MGQKIDLHPVIIIIALLISAKLFGIIGMLFAVPVAAVYRVLYKELWHDGSERQVDSSAVPEQKPENNH
jgi:predicted PurR-regulated permease PerM